MPEQELNTPQSFNEWLKTAREKRRISMRALALRTGVNYSTISRLERSNRTPGLATAVKLARGLAEYPRDGNIFVPGIHEQVSLDNFPSWLREQRVANQLSLRRLGKKAGVHHVTISRIENRENPPSLVIAGKLSVVFRTDE